MYAYRYLRRYVWGYLGVDNHGLKIPDAVSIFAKHNNLEVVGKPQNWIVQLYLSGQNEFIKRANASFYLSSEWLQLKVKVIERYGKRCMKCFELTESPHVDHIKPRSKFRELELCFDNLQVLCCTCNIKKSNRDFTDYRPESKGI